MTFERPGPHVFLCCALWVARAAEDVGRLNARRSAPGISESLPPGGPDAYPSRPLSAPESSTKTPPHSRLDLSLRVDGEDRVVRPGGIGHPLERIVVHCLEKKREDRFQSVRDLA